LIGTETDFKFIRSYLLNRLTIAERQIASRIATTIDTNTTNTTGNPLVQGQLDKTSKWIHNLIIHYTHEKRFHTSKNDIFMNYGIKHLLQHQLQPQILSLATVTIGI